MKILEQINLKTVIPLFALFLIANLYLYLQNQGVQISSEEVNEYDDIVFTAAEVDSAILDFIAAQKEVPGSLDDLNLSESLKEVLQVEDAGLQYEKLSATEYELIIKGIDDMTIVYKKLSPQEYELIVNGLDNEPIIFAGGESGHAK